MKFLDFDKVLVIAAHPDDAEYSLLGSILKFVDTTFHILVLSAGGDYDKTTSRDRLRECKAIWKSIDNIIGYSAPLMNDIPIGRRFVKNLKDDQIIHYIETSLDTDYDCVFTPPEQDSHFEHTAVNRLGHTLARKKKMGVISYRTPSTLDTWCPNLYVEINDLDEKIKLLSTFKSQSAHPYLKEEAIRYFHSNYQCLKRDMKYVESFRIESIYQ